jgi:hypothetical protein
VLLAVCRSAAWDDGIVVVAIPLLRGGVVTSIPVSLLFVQASLNELASGYSALPKNGAKQRSRCRTSSNADADGSTCQRLL